MSEPFTPHPNLSDEINNAIAESELAGGADLEKLAVGKKLIVQTRNTLYTIEQREDGLYISGNKRFCPEPTKCRIPGSNFGGSMLKMNYVGVGMYMEFFVSGYERVIITSEIQSVEEV
jgi:hypothetical protein